jgi:hypothetical protein
MPIYQDQSTSQVSPEFGTVALSANTGIGAGNTSVATALVMPGMTFTALTSGIFEVNISVHSNQTAANELATAVLVNASAPTIAIPNSETIIARNSATGEFSGSKTFTVTANAGDIFQVRGYSSTGASAFISNALGRSTLYWNKISGFLPVIAVGVATIGDAKSGFQTADHAGWILLDGRVKTTLTTTQQANATALGIGANIPDATGRDFRQGTLLAQIGSSTINQNNLPNTTLSVSGSTGNAGAHGHNINGNANGATGGSQGTFSTVSASSWNVLTGVGDHAHSVSGSTSSLNGGVTQQAYIPASIGVNQFIYLGV